MAENTWILSRQLIWENYHAVASFSDVGSGSISFRKQESLPTAMVSPVALRPVEELPGHEEALAGQDWLSVGPGSQCTQSVHVGWEACFGGCIGILGLRAAA